jgi:diguanylate cyclase (GGDEF)-like protein
LTEDLRQEAGKAAHKLAGVLGMFNREEGTGLAREIEHLFLNENQPSAKRQTRLGERVAALEQLLDLREQPVLETEAQLLLIDADALLLHDLQVSGRSLGLGWKQVTTLETAEDWLRSHTPQLVAISVEAIGLPATLQLLTKFSAHTPAIPTLILAAEADLRDRVTFAKAGGQSFLAKPVTATQVWETTTKLLQRHRSQTIQVLVVDDDPVFLSVLRSLIEPWGMVMTGLDDPLRFWQVLNAVAPDLLILDVEMPEIRGIELCQAVRLDPTWQSLPILFLTAHKGSEIVQQVFAAGADDFIVKPVVGPELLTRLTNRLERNRLLQTLSSQDPITGVANQPQSHRELELLWRQAIDRKQPFCLVVLSVVELRSIVLEQGHAAANQVLQSWGRVFRSSFTQHEPVGYWGNGEFVIGMVGLQPAEVNDRLADVLQTLRRQVFTAPDGKRFQAMCRVTIGVAAASTKTLHHLYQAAIGKL